MAEAIHIQLHADGAWHDAARLEVKDELAGPAGSCWLEYDFDWAFKHMHADRTTGVRALGSRFPVRTAGWLLARWPALLDDIRPSGAAERWWVDRLGLGRQSDSERAWTLLRTGTIAPVGHLRVREAVADLPRETPRRFEAVEVEQRTDAFLSYAMDRGAAVGGATGAGGDAPKLLLRQNDCGQIWLDTHQDDSLPDRHLLVKFPRGRKRRDHLILAAEHAYLRALSALGVETIATEGLRLAVPDEDGAPPSLWLPRFDVARDASGRMVRYGMESIYALLDAPAGSHQHHETCIEAVCALLSREPGYDPEGMVAELVCRDLLNVVFGNTDNHGRNSSVLHTPSGTRLAPVYDFAPMKLDLEVVVRTTRWRTAERAGVVDWRAAVDGLAHLADPNGVWRRLADFAGRLVDVPSLLEEANVPGEVLDSPVLALRRTREKLDAWGLIE